MLRGGRGEEKGRWKGDGEGEGQGKSGLTVDPVHRAVFARGCDAAFHEIRHSQLVAVGVD